MKTKLLFCLIACALLMETKNAGAAAFSWTGTTSTLWSVSANWAPNGHPGALDDVAISATANKPTVDVASLCKSITISGTTTLTLSAALTVSGGLTVNGGGNLTFAGLSSATFSGGSSGGNSSTLTIGVDNTVTFNAILSINAGGTLVNNGSLNSNSVAGIISANPGTITNNNTGIITLTTSQLTVGGMNNVTNSGKIIANTNSTIVFGNPCTFTNSNGASVTLTASALNFGGGTTVNNSGAITANSASSIVGNPVPITNSSTGTITLSASTLTLNGGSNITNSGAVSASLGSTVTFGNPSFINNTTNTSSLIVSASALNLGPNSSFTNSGTFTTSSASTVALNGNPTTITNNVNSTFTATSTTFTLVAGSAITNTGGNVSLTSSSISCSGNPSLITNQNSGATTGIFTLNATPVTFAGTNSIVNYGTFTANNGSPITMTAANTSSTITNYGTFFAGTSNSPANITLLGSQPKINNSSTVVAGVTYNGQFYLGSTSILYPTSANCLVTNNASCAFVLQSDAFGSAVIGPVPAGANPSPSLTGAYNIERYFQGSPTYDNVKERWLARNYRIISSPVNIGTKISGNNVFGLNYIVGATAGQTTGPGSATNAFITGAIGGNTSAGNPSIYLYRESITPSDATFTSGNFLGITNITNSTSAGTITVSDGSNNSIPIGTGVFFFFRGAATNWATRTSSPFIAPENVTLTSTGTLNQGQVIVKDWYNPTSAILGYTVAVGNAAVRGFNMVGNPYPSSIDWNTAFAATGITRTNINPTIWVFNPVTNQYDTYLTTSSNTGTSNGGGTDGTGNATNIIASGQGFFVQAVPGGASLVFNETAKSVTSQPTGSNLLMGTPVAQSPSQLLRLRLTIDTLNYDDIVIGFNSNASAKYNGLEDAEYLPGINAMEGLSSISSDSIALAINYLPLPKQSPQVIKLDVEGRISGRYKFQKTALDAIPQIYEIWLMDNYKKDSLDIRNNSTYAFNLDLTDTNSYGKNRFRLVIRQNPALAIHLLSFTAAKATGGAQVVWKTENEQNYTNFTVERSSDGGVTFNVLGGFASIALGSYSFLDKNPPVAADKYRLKIEDMNGAISYSNIVTLIYGNSDGAIPSNISVYPNPASSVLNLAINQNSGNQSPGLSALQKLSLTPGIIPSAGNPSFGIKIISTTGSVIRSANSSQPTWQDNISSLIPGTYIIQVVNNNDNSVVGKSTFVKL
jgi:trimeric autotransporter adhesin